MIYSNYTSSDGKRISSCHGFLIIAHNGYSCNFKYDKLSKADELYIEFLTKCFEKVKGITFEYKEDKKLISLSISKSNSAKTSTPMYACYVMLRFMLLNNNLIDEWFKLCTTYPKTDQFKLLLWVNDRWANGLDFSKNIYFHSFYNNMYNKTIFEKCTWNEFLAKDFTKVGLNNKFEQLSDQYETKEAKFKTLDRLLKKI